MSTSFLITGATGKQGRGTISALLAHPSFSPTSHTIYALTRDTASASAQRLASRSPAIKLIKGDLDNPTAIFSALPSPPTGILSVQLPGKNEVLQATSLIDAGIAASTPISPLKRFVQASVDRGGDQPSDVPHFRTKHEIEAYLKTKASEHSFTYTALRPVFFMDNLDWGFLTKIVATIWRDTLAPNQKLQMVDTRDIGPWAADALMGEPAKKVGERQGLENATVSLVGDELSFAEANKIFREETGRDLPTTWSWLAGAMLWLSHDIREMFRFFKETGFSGDLGEMNRSGRQVTGLREWVRQSSYMKKGQ